MKADKILSKAKKNEWIISSKFAAVSICLLYFFSYGLMFFHQGIFWDDWCLEDQKSDDIIKMFSMAGMQWVGYYHSFLHHLSNHILVYRAIIFTCYLLSGFVLFLILDKISLLNETDKYALAALFLIIPINSARITQICSPYALCFFAFFLGFYFYLNAFLKQKAFLLFIAYPLLFFSFFTQSLLLFSLLPAAFFSFKSVCEYKQTKRFSNKSVLFFLIYLLPFLFLFSKNTFSQPYGLMENYNKLKIENILLAYTNIEPSFQNSLQNIFILSDCFFAGLIKNVCLKKILFFALFLLFFKKMRKSSIFMICGVFLWILGSFSYNCLRPIDSSEWGSRDELLLGLGYGSILWGLINFFSSLFSLGRPFLFPKLQMCILSSFLVFFSLKNINTQAKFFIDWQKQLSLISNIKNNKHSLNNTLFFFKDNTNDLNIFQREYRFYEINGIFRRAFGNALRLGVVYSGQTCDDIQQGRFFDNYNKYLNFKEYNFWEFKKTKNACIILVERGTSKIGYKSNLVISAIYIYFLQIFKPQKYSEFLKNLIHISSEPLK